MPSSYFLTDSIVLLLAVEITMLEYFNVADIHVDCLVLARG